MTLGEMFEQLLMLMGKDQYAGYVTPNNFPLALNNRVQIDLMNAYVREYEKSREIGNDLRPFIKYLGDGTYAPLTLTPLGGNSPYSFAPFPPDFVYFSDGNFTEFINACGGATQKRRSVTWMDRADFDYRTGTSLLFPSQSEPIVSIQNNQIICCPALTSLNMAYLRMPNDVVFDYEIVTGNTIVYLPQGSVHTNSSTAPIGTPSASVELEWPENVHIEILNRLVRYYGRVDRDELDLTMQSTKPE